MTNQHSARYILMSFQSYLWSLTSQRSVVDRGKNIKRSIAWDFGLFYGEVGYLLMPRAARHELSTSHLKFARLVH
jgi:hypothetical protein